MMLKIALLFWFLMLPAVAQTLMVASAKGYMRPMEKIAALFEKKSGIKVETAYGNMKQIMTQVELGGKTSVVVGESVFLEKSGITFDKIIPLGQGRLVLAYPKNRKIEEIGQIANKEFFRIAVPDSQKGAIYGRAAMEFLQRSGLDEKVEAKLLKVDTVPQVSSYLIAGEVDAGFINLTDALGIQEKIGGFVVVDESLYGKISIVCGIVKGYENDRAVQSFAAFLQNPEVKAILKEAGL